jgi:hypothetical protein
VPISIAPAWICVRGIFSFTLQIHEYNVKTTEEMARAYDGFKYFAHFPRVITKMASSLEASST